MFIEIVAIALAALLHASLASHNVQPPYQVSILCEYQPGNPDHICNGAIVLENLVLTTASCLHYRDGSSKKKLHRLDASALSVLAGSSNAFTDAHRINVASIEIAEDFDSKTLENDIALLILNESIPLGTRPDMKWIMLDDNVHVNHSCLANFFSQNSNEFFNYYQTEELMLLNNEMCRNQTDHKKARKDDICSTFILPQQFDCIAAEAFLAFSNDRGTGLVCENFLVGLLSSVVGRPSPKNNCSDIALAAIYTNIFPHLMWIYRKMAKIETFYISTPYDASSKPLVVNYTYNTDNNVIEETRTTTMESLTTTNVTSFWNASTPMTNTTIIKPILTNATTWNSTTNSTIANGTVAPSNVSTSTKPAIVVVDSTTLPPWNSTTFNATLNDSTIQETHPTKQPNRTILKPPAPTIPTCTTTDSRSFNPFSTIRSFFTNSASPSRKFTATSLLIASVSLGLITICH